MHVTPTNLSQSLTWRLGRAVVRIGAVKCQIHKVRTGIGICCAAVEDPSNSSGVHYVTERQKEQIWLRMNIDGEDIVRQRTSERTLRNVVGGAGRSALEMKLKASRFQTEDHIPTGVKMLQVDVGSVTANMVAVRHLKKLGYLTYQKLEK